MPKNCRPCAKAMAALRERGTLRGAYAECADCQQGMKKLEQKHPRLARAWKPAHEFLTEPPKRRTVGGKQ